MYADALPAGPFRALQLWKGKACTMIWLIRIHVREKKTSFLWMFIEIQNISFILRARLVFPMLISWVCSFPVDVRVRPGAAPTRSQSAASPGSGSDGNPLKLQVVCWIKRFGFTGLQSYFWGSDYSIMVSVSFSGTFKNNGIVKAIS